MNKQGYRAVCLRKCTVPFNLYLIINTTSIRVCLPIFSSLKNVIYPTGLLEIIAQCLVLDLNNNPDLVYYVTYIDEFTDHKLLNFFINFPVTSTKKSLLSLISKR